MTTSPYLSPYEQPFPRSRRGRGHMQTPLPQVSNRRPRPSSKPGPGATTGGGHTPPVFIPHATPSNEIPGKTPPVFSRVPGDGVRPPTDPGPPGFPNIPTNPPNEPTPTPPVIKPGDAPQGPVDFDAWWRQNRPEDYYGNRRLSQDRQEAEGQGQFRRYQQDSSQRQMLEWMAANGATDAELQQAMRQMERLDYGRPGGTEAQNQLFEQNPATRAAYMAGNGLAETNGRVYGVNDPNVWYDAAGNPHTGPAPGNGGFGPGGYQAPVQTPEQQAWHEAHRGDQATPGVDPITGTYPTGNPAAQQWMETSQALGIPLPPGLAESVLSSAPAPANLAAPATLAAPVQAGTPTQAQGFAAPQVAPQQAASFAPQAQAAPQGAPAPGAPMAAAGSPVAPAGVPAGSPAGTAPGIGVPLTGAYESSGRALEDQLQAQLAGINAQRMQVQPSLDLYNARLNTDQGQATAALNDQMVGRGLLDSGVRQQSQVQQVNTPYGRARQDATLQAAQQFSDLDIAAAEAYADFNREYQDLLLNLAAEQASNPSAVLGGGSFYEPQPTTTTDRRDRGKNDKKGRNDRNGKGNR